MLIRFLFLVSLLIGLTLPTPLNATGEKAIQLNNRLRVMEEHDMVSPDPSLVEGDNYRIYLPKLVNRATELEVGVVFIQGLKSQDPNDIVWGFYDPENQMIAINTALSLNSQLSALFHELGHVLEPQDFMARDGDSLEKRRVRAEGGQVFAEVVSILACEALGLDTTHSSFSYLQTAPHRHEIIDRYANEIDAAVAQVLKGVK